MFLTVSFIDCVRISTDATKQQLAPRQPLLTKLQITALLIDGVAVFFFIGLTVSYHGFHIDLAAFLKIGTLSSSSVEWLIRGSIASVAIDVCTLFAVISFRGAQTRKALERKLGEVTYTNQQLTYANNSLNLTSNSRKELADRALETEKKLREYQNTIYELRTRNSQLEQAINTSTNPPPPPNRPPPPVPQTLAENGNGISEHGNPKYARFGNNPPPLSANQNNRPFRPLPIPPPNSNRVVPGPGTQPPSNPSHHPNHLQLDASVNFSHGSSQTPPLSSPQVTPPTTYGGHPPPPPPHSPVTSQKTAGGNGVSLEEIIDGRNNMKKMSKETTLIENDLLKAYPNIKEDLQSVIEGGEPDLLSAQFIKILKAEATPLGKRMNTMFNPTPEMNFLPPPLIQTSIDGDLSISSFLNQSVSDFKAEEVYDLDIDGNSKKRPVENTEYKTLEQSSLNNFIQDFSDDDLTDPSKILSKSDKRISSEIFLNKLKIISDQSVREGSMTLSPDKISVWLKTTEESVRETLRDQPHLTSKSHATRNSIRIENPGSTTQTHKQSPDPTLAIERQNNIPPDQFVNDTTPVRLPEENISDEFKQFYQELNQNVANLIDPGSMRTQVALKTSRFGATIKGIEDVLVCIESAVAERLTSQAIDVELLTVSQFAQSITVPKDHTIIEARIKDFNPQYENQLEIAYMIACLFEYLLTGKASTISRQHLHKNNAKPIYKQKNFTEMPAFSNRTECLALQKRLAACQEYIALWNQIYEEGVSTRDNNIPYESPFVESGHGIVHILEKDNYHKSTPQQKKRQ